MIHLERIVLREIHLPLVEPFQTAGGTVVARRVLLLELTDADGTTAWSECVAESLPSYSADTVDTCWLAITEWLAPRVLGSTFDTPRDVHEALDRNVRGHAMARAAIEMGVWALVAQRAGRPLAELLLEGSRFARNGGAVLRHDVATGIAVGMQRDPAALVARVEAARARGYQRVRIKVGPGRDVEYVRAVREALGDTLSLGVDANCSYTLADAEHVRALAELDGLGLEFIEQPLAHDDLVRHAELQRRLATPICLDESITGAARVDDAIALGSGRMINLKPGRVGGFTEAITVHDHCARAGIPMWCGGMLETGIGRAYNVALAALPNFTFPGDLSPSARYWARDIVRPEWTMDAEGRVRVPLDRPGIGVEVDTGMIQELVNREVVVTATASTR